ncbi:MAG TPA: threonine--tRNA ligase [Streptosporangiaceae bacterium]|nr:threonine--tRNA ligase [Streptosporangiaceae bacterium]
MLTHDKLYDHRRLGRELDVFDTDPLIGAGLPYWLPAGAAIRHALEEYVRELERRAGYQHVYSPVLGKRELYERSGHWEHYRDGMYPAMTFGRAADAGEQLVLRPSLCPHHAVMFAARARSYRELPLRMAELGGQYRAELSGVLGGLTRVRGMQLNDAHIFCTLDQVAGEAAAALAMIRQAHEAMGISPARYRLSLAGEAAKYVGSAQMWADATAMLQSVLADCEISYDTEAGEAAFYGPKIDIQVADAAEREASIATVQIDFYQPERFDLQYIGPDGARHRPVMVHRSLIGSAERAVANLIDVHGGAFPPWLAPVQLAALPVSDEQWGRAASLVKQATELGLRAELARDGTLAARIRDHKLVPYLAVIGPTEAASSEVSIRLRGGRKLPRMSTAAALAKVECQIAKHLPELWVD